MKFVVCSYFRAETEQALALAGLDGQVVTFPSHCGRPATDWGEIFDSENDATVVLGGCCTTNLDAEQWPQQNISIHHVDQCFYLFMQPELVDHYIARGYHLITPGWLSGWKNQIEHVMGFNQETARTFFQETARCLLLVDTGTHDNAEQLLQEMADYLEIPSERIATGLDYYSKLLQRLVDETQVSAPKQKLDDALKQQSEYAMVADLLGRLTDQKSEYDITHSLMSIFQMLLAPKQCSYLPWEENDFGQPLCSEPDTASVLQASIDPAAGDYGWIDEDGFWVRISSSEETFGFIAVEKIAFPQYRSRYLNMALLIRNVAALAINHARDFQKLSDLSHESGKGEVAREVIHNAGNVLNSINISVQQMQSRLEESATGSLPAIVELMRQQGERLGEFITSDPKGKKLPDYFEQLAHAVATERQQWQENLFELAESVDHVRAIVQSQSVSLRSDEAREPVSPVKLLNRLLDMYAGSIEQHGIHLERKMAAVPACALQKHKVMQVLGNLLKNAVEALASVESRPRELVVKVEMAGYDRFCFEVCDNGPGISDELKEKVFSHGFSTKEGHSGFGLHSASNLAGEMSGRLSCRAGDDGVGTCFRFELPLGMLHVKDK